MPIQLMQRLREKHLLGQKAVEQGNPGHGRGRYHRQRGGERGRCPSAWQLEGKVLRDFSVSWPLKGNRADLGKIPWKHLHITIKHLEITGRDLGSPDFYVSCSLTV